MTEIECAPIRVVSRTFRGSKWWGIAVATCAGFQAMMLAILVGLHPFLAMGALLGAIFVALGFLAGDVVYTLDDRGVSRAWRPLAARFLALATRERFAAWDQVEAYRHDTDLKRSLERVEFLEIDVAAPQARWLVTDGMDRAGFERFVEAFEARAAAPPLTRNSADVRADALAGRTGPIRRRPSFYQTAFAKALTLVFVLATLALAAVGYAGGLSAGHVLRLVAVVLPGTAYMVWRSWLTPRG